MIRLNLFNRYVRGAVVAALGLAMLAATPAIRAADEKPAEEDKGAKAVEAIALAEQLIRFGRANENAQALILAARLLHQNPTDESKATSEGGTKIADEKVDLAGLVKEARAALKEDDKELEQLIARVADEIKEDPRGAVGGAKKFAYSIAAGQTLTLPAIKFEANKPATIHVHITPTAAQIKAYQLGKIAHGLVAVAHKKRADANAALRKASQMFANAAKLPNADAKAAAAKAAEAQGDLAAKLAQDSDNAADKASAACAAAHAASAAATDPEVKALAILAKAAHAAAVEEANEAKAFGKEMTKLFVIFRNTGKDSDRTKLDAVEKAFENAKAISKKAHDAYLVALEKLNKEKAEDYLHVQLVEGTKVVKTADGKSVTVSATPAGAKNAAVDLKLVITNKSPDKTLVLNGYTN